MPVGRRIGNRHRFFLTAKSPFSGKNPQKGGYCGRTIYETCTTNTAEITPEIMPGSLSMDADSDGLVYHYETALFTELKDYYNCTMSDTSASSTGEELSDHNLVEYYYHVVQFDP